MPYDEFGDEMFKRMGQVAAALEKRVAEWGSDDEECQGDDAEDGGGARKGLPEKRRKKLHDLKTWQREGRLIKVTTALREALGVALFEDHNVYRNRVETLKEAVSRIPAAVLVSILKAVSWRVETAPLGIVKVHKPGKPTRDAKLGLYDAVGAGKPCVVEYEPDSDLRDPERMTLLEEGGMEAFIRREMLPFVPDACVNNDATKIGYPVSFTRYFYKPRPLRTLVEINAGIPTIEKKAEGLLDGLLMEAIQP